MAEVTSLTLNTAPPASSTSCAWSDDGVYLAVTNNVASGVQLVIYKLEGDQLTQVASEPNASWAYGSIGVSWHSSGDVLFVQCNRSSGQIPSNYTVFFTFNKVTNALTHFLPPRPNPTGIGLGFGAIWWGDYAVTHHALTPYFPIYRYDGGTSLTHIAPVANTTLGGSQVSGYALHPNETFLLAITSAGNVVKITKSGETFTVDDVTLPGHAVVNNQLQNICWDETGTYLLVTNHGSDNELYSYNSGTDTYTKLTLPSSTANRGRAIFWCTRKKGFVQPFHSPTTTAEIQILTRNATTGVWGYSVYEDALPVIPNTRNISAAQNSSLIAISTTTAPTVRAFRIVDLIRSDGILTAKKPTIAGSVSVPIGVKGNVAAPKAGSSGLIGVPNGIHGSARAPKSLTEGALAASVGEEPAIELFRTFPAVVMIENSAFGFETQDATSIAIYGGGTAPKAKFNGIFKQPIEVNGALNSPKAKAAGTLFLIEPDRRTLIGEWSAPKATVAGEASIGLSVMPSHLTAPKARFEGLGELPAAGRADLVAPKPVLNGAIAHLYVNADLQARVPVVKGIADQPRILVEEGFLKAPAVIADGTLEYSQSVRAKLTARKAKVDGVVWQDIHVNATLSAPKAKLAGELDAPVVFGSLVAPKAKLAGELVAPAFTGTLTAPKAKLDANISVPTAVSGELKAPKARFKGEALRYIRVDALARAPKATMAGVLGFVPKFTGNLTARKARVAGTLSSGFEVTGSFVAPKPAAAGELKSVYNINGDLVTLKPIVDGIIANEFAVIGLGSAPLPLVAGDLHLRNLLSGDLTAPSPVVLGDIHLRYLVNGDVLAPKAVTEGELKLTYLINGDLTPLLPVVDGLVAITTEVSGDVFAPAAVSDGNLHVRYLVNCDVTAPAAIASGELHLLYKVDGDMVAPRPAIEGELLLRAYVEGIGSAPSPSMQGELHTRYLVEGIGSSLLPVMNGVLGTAEPADVSGDLMAPRPILEGILNNIEARRRRALTIIRP